MRKSNTMRKEVHHQLTALAVILGLCCAGMSVEAGKLCSGTGIWKPSPGTTWQWQIGGGAVDTSLNVQMYDIDMFGATQSVIDTLHASGRAVVCYFSTQYEDWRPDASQFTSAVLGSALDGWPGERWVDIRSSVVRNIMKARLDLAASKGCDGVEPDNVDEYSNSNGLGITANDQLDFNKFMVQEAHARGLSIGLKNDIDQISALASYYDWALNEQCVEYGECSGYQTFISQGKAVFGVEYTGTSSSFCPTQNNNKYSWLKKKLELDAWVEQCCTYASGGCKSAPYTCSGGAPSTPATPAPTTATPTSTPKPTTAAPTATPKPTTAAPTSTPKPTTAAPTSTPKPTTAAPTSTPKPTTAAPTSTPKPTTAAPTSTPKPTTAAPTSTPKPTTAAPTSAPSAAPVTSTPGPTTTAAPSTQYRFYPTQTSAQYGRVSTQPITALATRDQTGSNDNWAKYMEFDAPASRGYQGTITVGVPALPANIVSAEVTINFKGPKESNIKWSWSILNRATGAYVALGTNAKALDWSWSELKFAVPGQFYDYVATGNGGPELSIQMTSSAGGDSCNLDFLEVKVGTSTAAAARQARDLLEVSQELEEEGEESTFSMMDSSSTALTVSGVLMSVCGLVLALL